NNGTINCNGYTLTYSSNSGSGTINETTGIASMNAESSDAKVYTLDGRMASDCTRGIVIKNGKKIIRLSNCL
ncbi:MAG: hypothetical protein IJ243_10900, partial [Prevotella sp.]|nr:hypothetical protein [Prevotella sp.]